MRTFACEEDYRRLGFGSPPAANPYAEGLTASFYDR
jgi:hypothetical protein